jgi:kinesin family protein 11
LTFCEQAAREKNGIYFAKETWAEIAEEHESRRIQHEEARRQVEILQSQIRAVREEFEECMGLLMQRDNELKETKEALEVKTINLERTEQQLSTAQRELEEEVVMSEAYARSETNLDGIARGLRSTVEAVTNDIGKLHDKLGMYILFSLWCGYSLSTVLGRQSELLSSNSEAVHQFGQAINGELREFSSQLEDFTKQQSQLAKKLRQQAEQFQATETEVSTFHFIDIMPDILIILY